MGKGGFCLTSSPEVLAEVSEHLQLQPAGEGATSITGLAPAGPADQLAEEPEEPA